MNDERRATWERYVASWKVESLAEKQALFETCLSPSCVYRDPLTEVRGWTELSRYMAGLQEQVPGAHFVTEHFITHHGRSLATWKMMSGDSMPIGEGMSYGEYDDRGRLIAMTGFFETPASKD